MRALAMTDAPPSQTTPPPRVADVIADLDQVGNLLRSMLVEGRVDEAIALVVKMIAHVRDHNNALERRLAYLVRQVFGRRSEKIDPAQLALALGQLLSQDTGDVPARAETSAPDAAKAAEAPAAPPPERKASKHAGRSALPAHLPREVHRIKPHPDKCICALCGGAKEVIGVEKSEVLDFRPASLFVRVNEREKLACRPCEKDVVIAPPAPTPIEKGRPGPGLLAQVVVAKAEDHLPLNRQSKIFAREGIRISDSTLGSWFASAAEMLEPISREIQQRVLSAFAVQADATGLAVLDKNHPKKIRLGTVWSYVGDGKHVAFVFGADGKSTHVESFLAPRTQGYLQGDGDERLEKICRESDGRLIKTGCWMHARRYFERAYEAKDLRAAFALDRIGKLYDVEERARTDGVDIEERRRRRQELSRPLIDELRKWIVEVHERAPPASPMGKATRYALGQWDPLLRYLEDGRLSIDNGECERQIRRIAVGRKNWWYAGSDRGARNASTVWTVLGTCALNGVSPWHYLRDLFDRLSDRANAIDVAEWMPEAWRARQDAAQSSASK